MVGEEGRSIRPRKRKSRRLTYFYLDGDLYRSLHINRGEDTVMAWSYPQHKRVGFVYSDVKANHERAYRTAEVAAMVNRSRKTIERAMDGGHIEIPQHTYGLQTGKLFQYMWNEKYIMGLHDYLKTVHQGRPRNDGRITTYNLPTARELRAMIRHQVVTYVQTEEGEFVPTWKNPF